MRIAALSSLVVQNAPSVLMIGQFDVAWALCLHLTYICNGTIYTHSSDIGKALDSAVHKT